MVPYLIRNYNSNDQRLDKIHTRLIGKIIPLMFNYLGLTYTFECYRSCESPPVHNSSASLFPFVPWNSVSNPYNTTCVEYGYSTTGCFIPLYFQVSGPLPIYSLSDWSSNYPLYVNDTTSINFVCKIGKYEYSNGSNQLFPSQIIIKHY